MQSIKKQLILIYLGNLSLCNDVLKE